MSILRNKTQVENIIIYNKKYERVFQNPISRGAFGWVFLVKDINNGQK